jgi:hypothetical protein
MDKAEQIIADANPAKAAEYAVAAIKRVGQLGLEAGEQLRELAEANAGEPEFEEGLAYLND